MLGLIRFYLRTIITNQPRGAAPHDVSMDEKSKLPFSISRLSQRSESRELGKVKRSAPQITGDLHNPNGQRDKVQLTKRTDTSFISHSHSNRIKMIFNKIGRERFSCSSTLAAQRSGHFYELEMPFL